MSLVNTNNRFVTCETQVGTAGAAATLTLAAVAGARHAITNIHIMRATGTAETGNATLDITTTNLPDSMSWTVGNGVVAGGTQTDVDMTFDPPLLSSVVGTATTVVMADPGTNPIWSARVFYYTVPEI